MHKKKTTVKNKKIDSAVAAQESLERGLKDCRESFELTEPTINYKVGDRVQHGHIKLSVVSEVVDDGKILKLHEIVTNENYGNPYDYERDMYVCWWDVVPYIPLKNQIPSLIKNERLQLHFMQQEIMSIFTYYYHFGINMEPDYQCGYVWSLEDKKELINSIFNNIEIGKFVLIKLPFINISTPEYEVLDGKQRISALIQFYENRFSWNGVYFKALNYYDQSHFEGYPVSVAQVDNITPQQKLEYFLRLNTFGKVIDKAQIEKVQKQLELLKSTKK